MSGALSATSCYIDAYGIHGPAYQDVLTYLQTSVKQIYGADIYLGNDSQDEQLLAIFAAAINDTNSLAIAVYNSYAPITAQGTGLSNAVKLNGIARLIPTNSQVDVVIGGVVGTIITDGVVSDSNSVRWTLPPQVIIPVSGAITVTATCTQSGAVVAIPGDIKDVASPSFGWQTVTNLVAATPGSPVESDFGLRVRQAASTMLPSTALLDGILGGVANITGVTRYRGYENETYATDANGLPPKSIAIVVEGGDAQAIFQVIYNKKSLGAYTFGDNVGTVFDANNTPRVVRFFRPDIVPITCVISITPLNGYTNVVGVSIVNAVVAYINTQDVGDPVLISKLYTPANLSGLTGASFNITSITLARNNGIPNASDVFIAFNEAATTDDTLTTVRTA